MSLLFSDIRELKEILLNFFKQETKLNRRLLLIIMILHYLAGLSYLFREFLVNIFPFILSVIILELIL
jgi:hypothetical protein